MCEPHGWTQGSPGDSEQKSQLALDASVPSNKRIPFDEGEKHGK